MPGAFPFHPQPDPEENSEYTSTYTQEASEPLLAEEPINTEQPESSLEPSRPTASPSASMDALPPEAQGEANGGPLGCCLGITVGIMLSLFLGVIGFGHLTASVIVFLVHADAITEIRIATGFFAIVGAILGGYLGWKVGKRVYREYESPVIKARTSTRKSKPRPKEARL